MGRTSVTQKLGKHLRQLRLDAGVTQEKLSIATGISQTYISGVERGKRNPSLKTMEKFAKALGVSVKELASFNDYKIKDNSKILRHP